MKELKAQLKALKDSGKKDWQTTWDIQGLETKIEGSRSSAQSLKNYYLLLITKYHIIWKLSRAGSCPDKLKF